MSFIQMYSLSDKHKRRGLWKSSDDRRLYRQLIAHANDS